MQRPCLGCSRLIPSGSRCDKCRPKRAPTPGRKGRTATDWTWRKISAAQRKRVPFCELRLAGCNGKAEATDHIIPLDDAPELVYEPLNLRSACSVCNGRRSDRVTDQERQQVLDAVKARKQRHASYYLSQQENHR